MKKFVVVSHCILNQHAVVKGLERGNGAFNFAKILCEESFGIIQLPCFEMILSGKDRPGMTYEEYDTQEYRKLISEGLIPYILQIENYLENNYYFQGFIGIEESPTCSTLTKQGLMIEELVRLLAEKSIKFKMIGVPTSYSNNAENNQFINKLKTFLGVDDEKRS